MKNKRRATATAVAAVTSAGVMVGGAFPAPQELLRGDEGEVPAPITEMLPADGLTADSADDVDEELEDEDEERRRSSPGSRVRAWVLALPLAVRAGVGVPLWCIGWLVLTGLSALWTGLLSPALGTVLGWAATALVVLSAFALTAKAVFPDVPLKKIVNKRSFFGVLAGTAAMALANAVLPLFFDGYDRVAKIFHAAATAGLLGAVTALYVRREKKRRTKLAAESEPPAPEPPESPEEAQERALRLAREMVDEVSTRRRRY